MKEPRLNRRLVLETPDRISDGSGGFQVSWSELGTLWAQVTTSNGRETANALATIARVGLRITVRAALSGAANRPIAGQRFREGARVYKIEAVLESDPDGRYLTCVAAEETVS